MTTQTSAEPILTLTDEAAAEVKARLAAQGQGKGLRLSVEEGGCSGMQYALAFEEKQAGDIEYEDRGLPIYVDASSADYLRGSVLEFSGELLRGGFLIHNPNAQSSCGCGHSFHT
jgi:iron-sulfur cluster assembly accessory protein